MNKNIRGLCLLIVINMLLVLFTGTLFVSSEMNLDDMDTNIRLDFAGGDDLSNSVWVKGYTNITSTWTGLPDTANSVLQRLGENGAQDGSIILNASDKLALQVRSVFSKDNLSVSKMIFEYSADGSAFSVLPDESVERYVDVEDVSGFQMDVFTLPSLPQNTKNIKITFGVTVSDNNAFWFPMIDFIDIYNPKAVYSSDRFDFTDYDKKQRLDFNTGADGLENSYIYSSYNVKSSPTGMAGSAAYCLQRLSENGGESGSAVFNVTDKTVMETRVVFNRSDYSKFCFKFELSADGINYTGVSAGNIIRYIDQSEFETDFRTDIFTVKNLPADTKYLKMTFGTYVPDSSIFWLPLIDYVDFYTPSVSDGFSLLNYNKYLRLGFTDQGDGLENDIVKETENVKNTIGGVAYTDDKGWCVQKAETPEDGYFTLNVDDKMVLSLGAIVHKDNASIAKVKLQYSLDNITYHDISADALLINQDKFYISNDWTAMIYTVKSLPAGTRYFKVIIGTTNKSGGIWWMPMIDYLDIYVPNGYTAPDKPVEKTPYDFTGLKKHKHLGFTDKGDNLSDVSVYDFNNVHITTTGNPTTDPEGWVLQKDNNTAQNGDVTFRVNDQMTVDIGVITHIANFDKTEVLFYTSADGKSFTPLVGQAIETRRYSDGAPKDFIFYQNVIKTLPKGTKFLKVSFGTTEKETELWWMPFIDYVDFYLPPTFSGDVLGSLDEGSISPYTGFQLQYHLDFDTLQTELVHDRKDVQNAAAGIIYTDEFGNCLQRTTGAGKGWIVFNVEDYMQFEVCEIVHTANFKKSMISYEMSSDGASWTRVTDGNIESMIIRSDAPQDYTVVKRKIKNLAAGTIYFRIALDCTEKDFWWMPVIDYMDFYVPDAYYIPEDLTKGYYEGLQSIRYLKLLYPEDSAYIFITDDVITVDLKGSVMMVAAFLKKLNPTRYSIEMHDENDELIADHEKYIANGMLLTLMDDGKSAREYSIIVLNPGKVTIVGEKSDAAVSFPIWPIILTSAGGALFLTVNAAALIIKLRKRA